MSTIRVVNLQHTDATVPNIVLESDGTSVFASGITISGTTTLTVSGTAEFASGTVSAPGITFIDDNNTGIYEPAVDTVAITTAATERLRIDNSGNVGIGTISAARKLVVSNGGAEGFEFNPAEPANTNLTLHFNRNTSTYTTNQVRAADHTFYIGSSEKVRIDSSGNVGIGTTSSGAKLHVTYSAGNPQIIIERTTSSTAKYGLHAFSNSFSIRDEAQSSDRLRIDSSGYVGIGTTNPTSRLTVIDTTQDIQARFGSLANTCDPFIRFQGRNIADDRNCFADIQLDSENQLLLLNDPGANGASIGTNPVAVDSTGRLLVGTTATAGLSSNAMLVVDSDSSSAVRVNLVNSGSSAVESTQFGSQNNDLFFNTSSSEKMRILSGGGITFNGDTAAANALDDYEEGTFTPTFGNLSNFSYSTQTGKYVKIGKIVTVYIMLATQNAASISGTGTVYIGGLPFDAENNSNAGTSMLVLTHDNRFTNNPRYGQIQSGSKTRIVLFKTNAMNSANGLIASDFTATNSGNYNLLSVNFTYEVD